MGTIHGPYTVEDFKVMQLLKAGIRRMEKKDFIYADLLTKDKNILKDKYLRRVA